MSKNLDEFEAAVAEDGLQYALLNATGQAFGLVFAQAIKHRHLFKQADGVERFNEELYDLITDNEDLQAKLSPESIAVLHGAVEGIEKAIDLEEE